MTSLQERIVEAAQEADRLPAWALRVNDAMRAGRFIEERQMPVADRGPAVSRVTTVARSVRTR
jgi:hypothetical protein